MFGIEKRIARNSIKTHIKNHFQNSSIHEHQWIDGQISKSLSGFSVYEIAPSQNRSLWTYISSGAFEIKHQEKGMLEFMLIARERNKRHILTLAMIAYYHICNPLGVGHTFPIGESWLEGSICDHILVSRPYVYGPEFEICRFRNQHIHILWLVPITKAERDYKSKYGLKALEDIFEESNLEYWKVDRTSLV